MIRSILCTASALALSISALPAAACGKAEAPPVIRLTVSSPLTMLQHGPATDVAIDAGGCVTTRFPAIDKRAGMHRYQLEASEFEALKREVRAARLVTFDEAAVKAKLGVQVKMPSTVEHVTTDADIIQLELAAGLADAKSAAAKSIRFSGIDAALMNHPEIADLQSLAAVKDRLMEVADQTRESMETSR